MAGAGTTSASDDHFKEILVSIQRRVEKLSPPSDCCIFTVPEALRGTNKKAYTPRVVAIGPYHRLTPSLMPMENHKLWYLKNFFERNPKCRLEAYFERVTSWVDEARNCYDKHINLKPNKFAEMMLLDGIFVIQLFLMYWNPQWRMRGDRIFNKPYMLKDVRRDMTLLENQMPFFAIRQLFDMAFRTHQEHMPGLLELMCWFFRIEKLPEAVMESEVKHLIDAVRLSILQSVKKVPYESNEKEKFTPSATQLVAAGVKLRSVLSGESKCLFDIKFENGVLKIPRLALYDSTESEFRNIIAFEQCYHLTDRYLTDYMAFMDHLVDTPDDAQLLIDKNIIENWLSDKEAVARLINGFCKEVSLSEENYYFNSLSNKLVEHCAKRCNKWKATFKRNYWSNPCVAISFIAAVVLLLLTIAQTLCSVLSLI